MNRIILDTSKSIADLYIVSDSYLRTCKSSATILDQNLLNYIDSASKYQILIDTNVDIFDGVKVEDFRTIRTDGVWFWSADLSFYTKNHHFTWPQNFLTYVANKEIRRLTLDELYEIPENVNNTLFNATSGIKYNKEEMINFNIIKI